MAERYRVQGYDVVSAGMVDGVLAGVGARHLTRVGMRAGVLAEIAAAVTRDPAARMLYEARRARAKELERDGG